MRLRRWADDTVPMGSGEPSSLRARLSEARAERATAEAELNQSLGTSLKAE